MYLYESHLGGYYTSEDEIPYEDLYCVVITVLSVFQEMLKIYY